MAASDTTTNDDPYLFLEEVESPESIAFAKSANEKCLSQLGDPSDTDTYKVRWFTFPLEASEN